MVYNTVYRVLNLAIRPALRHSHGSENVDLRYFIGESLDNYSEFVANRDSVNSFLYFSGAISSRTSITPLFFFSIPEFVMREYELPLSKAN